ncbi:integrase [Elizabethkingia anophelis]|uniref:site-specific integrase n=1 Tax=Elizabethkingia anophelis TaxID=1117645 RepID=UPI00293D0377|nr:integrase [Elizabethkingia anophelis]MDV4023722.1 integrase [Elizabethkingia anophelis]
MLIKYNAQFLLDKEKDNPTAKLRFRVKWNGNIVAFNVGYRVEIEKWSTDTQRCKINTSHGEKKVAANVINRKIQQYESACENIFSKFILNNKVPEADEFRNSFNTEIGKVSKVVNDHGFFDVFDTFAYEESVINQWTPATHTKIQTLKNHLLNFDANLAFEDLTEQKLTDFQFYLQNDLNFKNTTILKQIAFFKWFLKWAKKKGYNQNIAFEIFKPKLKTTQKKVIFLTWSELTQLREYKIPQPKQYLERVRDVFLFQCFTGLRYSDVFNLKRSDIKENHIEITTVKTSDSLVIELNKFSKAILEKYKNVHFEGDKVLPVISNQKTNDFLKELAELAGIDEPVRETYYKGNQRIDEVTPKYALLGTHAGRRTFICNSLSLGIPPQVVMKWTGHSDYKAMKPYIDIADEIKVNAMDKFNQL